MKHVAGVLLGLAVVVSPAQVAAGSGHTDGPTSSALGGCQATPIGDEGWAYNCSDVKADIIDDARQIRGEAYFEGTKAFVEAAVGTEGTRVTRDRSRIGGREAEVQRAARGAAVAITALLAFPAGTRILTCIARPAERCGPVLDELAAGPWRGAAAKGAHAAEVPNLRIGDYEPKVPNDCRARPTVAGGQIICPGGFLVFWGPDDDEGTLLRAFRDRIENGITGGLLPQSAEIQRKDLPCRIAGDAATCSSMSVSAGGRRYVALWGGLTVKGVRTMAACTSDGQTPIPSPCSAVFEER